MPQRPWMPLYIGDFLAKTMHLGATETGIYIRLIMHCWEHGTIPNDPRKLAIITHCDTRLWHQYEKTVLQFFDAVDASTMHNKRVSTELHRAAELSNKRKGAAEQMLRQKAAKLEQLLTHARASSQSHLQSLRANSGFEGKSEENGHDPPEPPTGSPEWRKLHGWPDRGTPDEPLP